MTAPHFDTEHVTVWHGDCIDVMRDLPDASVDAVCTDPPYALEFMGKGWDTYTPLEFEAWCAEWAAECLRLLKPGGHLLAFGGTRTHHRLASGIEDAGFEIRDSIFWAYGSGFPKSLNVTDALGRIVPDDARCACGPRSTRTAQDSPAGYPSSHGSGDAQLHPGSGADRSSAPSPADAPARTRAGQRADAPAAAPASSGPDAGTGHLASVDSMDLWAHPSADAPTSAVAPSDTRTSTSAGPATATRRTDDRTPSSFDLASVAPSLKCDRCGCVVIPEGVGTALKPAAEPVVVARKPLTGTVAANVLAYGTGALNIDASRIPMSTEDAAAIESMTGFGKPGSIVNPDAPAGFRKGTPHSGAKAHTQGRWPANVVLSADQAAALDQQSGVLTSGALKPYTEQHENASSFRMDREKTYESQANSGGASRFFKTVDDVTPRFMYTAKAGSGERPKVEREGGGNGRVTGLGGKVRQCNVCGTRAIESGAVSPSCGHEDFFWADPTTSTTDTVSHPTVKPLDLMRWLVKLVTPKGGTVLEPFAGSGTTVEAAVLEGFRCIAIEREADYLPLIMQRVSKPHAVGLDFGDWEDVS